MNDTYEDVKNPYLRWAMSQGVVSFLLIMILCGGGYGMYIRVPQVFERVHQGYLEIQAKEDARYQTLIDAFDREMDRRDRLQGLEPLNRQQVSHR